MRARMCHAWGTRARFGTFGHWGGDGVGYVGPDANIPVQSRIGFCLGALGGVHIICSEAELLSTALTIITTGGRSSENDSFRTPGSSPGGSHDSKHKELRGATFWGESFVISLNEIFPFNAPNLARPVTAPTLSITSAGRISPTMSTTSSNSLSRYQNELPLMSFFRSSSKALKAGRVQARGGR